jgi:single-stranded DNA-binding protein
MAQDNNTLDPEVRYTEGGIARARFRVAVSGRREQEASFFTVVLCRSTGVSPQSYATPSAKVSCPPAASSQPSRS